MSNTSPRQRRTSVGFTLIELLLVMVILVVLASVVVMRFGNSAEKARVSAAKADIATISSALQKFKIDNGRFPTTEEGLAALIERPSNALAPQSEWPYLEKGVPLDPWKKPYIYRCPPEQSRSDFDLLSGGPDLAEGGNDDITSWEQ